MLIEKKLCFLGLVDICLVWSRCTLQKNCLLCLWIWQFSFITNDFLPLIKYIFVGIDMCEYIYQIMSLLCYELVTDFQCRNFHSWWDSTMAQCLHNYVYSDCNQCFQFSESEQIYDSTFLVYGFCFHFVSIPLLRIKYLCLHVFFRFCIWIV